jgi:uncharacterized protein
MLDLAPMVAKMDAAGVDRVVLIPSMNDPLPSTPQGLLKALRFMMRSGPGRILAERIHRALLTAEGDLRLQGQVFQIYSRPDNETVARAVSRHPDRFLGWIFLNPRNNPRVVDELEEWRARSGMIGVKLHPHWHDYRTEALHPLLQRAEELRMPVLIHLGFGARGDYRVICERYPRLVLISAHAGFPFYDDLWRVGRRYPNLYVDLSSPYIDEPLARAAVAALGAERCLYGTDSPYGFHLPDDTYDYQHIKGWVERMPLSSAQQGRIFAENFNAILGERLP